MEKEYLRIKKEVERGYSNSEDVWSFYVNDMMFLIKEIERLKKIKKNERND